MNVLPPKVDVSLLRISFEVDLDERFFRAAGLRAAGRTFLPDICRRFDCFTRALATVFFRAAFFFGVLLFFICPSRPHYRYGEIPLW